MVATAGTVVAGLVADPADVRLVWIAGGAGLISLAAVRVLTPAICRLGEPAGA
jgi:hypothetical protein